MSFSNRDGVPYTSKEDILSKFQVYECSFGPNCYKVNFNGTILYLCFINNAEMKDKHVRNGAYDTETKYLSFKIDDDIFIANKILAAVFEKCEGFYYFDGIYCKSSNNGVALFELIQDDCIEGHSPAQIKALIQEFRNNIRIYKDNQQ